MSLVSASFWHVAGTPLRPEASTDANCGRCGMADLASTVHQCPLVCMVFAGDCYSPGYSVIPELAGLSFRLQQQVPIPDLLFSRVADAQLRSDVPGAFGSYGCARALTAAAAVAVTVAIGDL